MRTAKKFPLKMDFTPIFMSGFAIWRFAPGIWPSIRKSLLRERRPVCEICDFPAQNRGLIDAHEVFAYRKDRGVRLTRIQLLCKRCHDCKHFDHAIRMGRRERREILIAHFCEVNVCHRVEFDRHLVEAQNRKQELEIRYPANLNESRVHYGPYHDRVLASRRRRRQHEPNWWQATERAIKYAVNRGLHPDYGDQITDAARNDGDFRDRLLACIQSEKFEDAYLIIIETLAEEWDAQFWEPLSDHELTHTPEGELYGHRWPGE